jgi:hypothetical protein
MSAFVRFRQGIFFNCVDIPFDVVVEHKEGRRPLLVVRE